MRKLVIYFLCLSFSFLLGHYYKCTFYNRPQAFIHNTAENICYDLVSLKEFDQITYDQIKYRDFKFKKFNVSKDLSLHYRLSRTTKGNGAIEIVRQIEWKAEDGIVIKIYGRYRDNVIFKNRCLQVKIKDLNDDGYKDLLIHGIAQFIDEGGKVESEKSIVSIFLFNKKTENYEAVLDDNHIEHWSP